MRVLGHVILATVLLVAAGNSASLIADGHGWALTWIAVFLCSGGALWSLLAGLVAGMDK